MAFVSCKPPPRIPSFHVLNQSVAVGACAQTAETPDRASEPRTLVFGVYLPLQAGPEVQMARVLFSVRTERIQKVRYQSKSMSLSCTKSQDTKPRKWKTQNIVITENNCSNVREFIKHCDLGHCI